MEIAQEVRYRPYQDWTPEEIKIISKNVASSPWHASYHIEPKTGLLNDPNGFSYFNGQFHLFYQNWPFGAAHGLKQWVHLVSDDLLHFKETGIKLLPDHKHDSHGAYSGSAYAVNDKLFLFYTGNVRDENWVRDPLQVGAYLDAKGQITKCESVLIQQPDDVTEHFRDPQIFNYKNQFYAIVGAQDLNKKGMIKLYKAINNDVENWSFVANLDIGRTASEYMIECPNLVFIDEKPVLIYSPQGLSKAELAYDNIYPNTYQVFDAFDPEKGKLLGGSDIQNLDFGFEAYATQAFNTPDGSVLAVSWIGLPDIHYPTDSFDYQGALSLIKELTLVNGQLHQFPVSSVKSLRQNTEKIQNKSKTSNCYELELRIKGNEKAQLQLFSDESTKTGLLMTIDTKEGKCVIDRSQVGQQYALEYGNCRSCQIPQEDVTLNIYVDKSIIEIYINQGQAVLTSRVFPENEASGIQILSGDIDGYYYELR